MSTKARESMVVRCAGSKTVAGISPCTLAEEAPIMVGRGKPVRHISVWDNICFSIKFIQLFIHDSV
jgi:hypothetical protein